MSRIGKADRSLELWSILGKMNLGTLDLDSETKRLCAAHIMGIQLGRSRLKLGRGRNMQSSCASTHWG